MKLAIICITALLIVSGPAFAGNIEGANRFLCAPTDSVECNTGGKCARGEANNVNLPDFVEIDLEAKTMQGLDTGRTTPIKHVARNEGNLVLQGVEAGRGWSMTVTEANGHVTLAVANEGRGFIVFGACTPR